MTSRKLYLTLLIISLVISTSCLGLGLILTESWLGLPVLAVFLVCWAYSIGNPSFWKATCALIGYLVLTAALVLRDVSVYLLIVACTAALTSWELVLFKNSTAQESSSSGSRTSLEKNHLKSLGLAAALGLVIAWAASLIRIEIPFGWLVILGLAVMAALVFGFQLIQEQINSK